MKIITFKELREGKEVDSVIPLDYDQFDNYQKKLLYKDTIIIPKNTTKIQVCISHKVPDSIFELVLDKEEKFSLFYLVKSIAGLFKFIYNSEKYQPDHDLKILYLKSINYDKNTNTCFLSIIPIH